MLVKLKTTGLAEHCVKHNLTDYWTKVRGINNGGEQLHCSPVLRRFLDWVTSWRRPVSLFIGVSESVASGTVFWVLASKRLSTTVDGYQFDA